MLGYAAMNRTLRERDPPRRCNRDMRNATWESEGLDHAAGLAERNLRDLRAILAWNLDHDIRFYRCSSTLIPWNSAFDIEELLERAAADPDHGRQRYTGDSPDS